MKIIEQKLTIPSVDGLPIWLTIWQPETGGPYPVVIVLPGTKGFTRWGSFPYFSQKIAESGRVVIGVDYSCSGVVNFESEITRLDLVEKDSPKREVAEVNLVINELSKDVWKGKIKSNDITLLGHSRGSAVAILAAHNSAVTKLVLWGAVSHLNRYTPEQLETWEKVGRHNLPNARTGQDYFLGQQFLADILSFTSETLPIALKEAHKPTLIVKGDDDKAIPDIEAGQLLEAIGPNLGTIHIVPGGDHNFGAVHPFVDTTPQLEEAISTTIEWLNDK